MVDALQKKIIRDIGENRIPFVAIICICALGIALFSGLNLYVSTVENELAGYYRRTNLADYWIYKAEFSDADLESVRLMDDVKEVQLRKVTDLFLSGSSGRQHIHALNETPLINIPELLDGNPLGEEEPNARATAYENQLTPMTLRA